MTELTVIQHADRPTILGQGPCRIPTGGKIRAGIKVLTKAAAAHAEAQRIYAEGVASGLSFDEIEGILKRACPGLLNPLAPKNVPWFTAHPSDFANPAIAAELLARYGEVRQDGVLRLYRFPVIFPADQWPLVMPHQLVAWGSSGRKYWSEYSSDGQQRACMQYAAPAVINGRQVVRVFGGRRTERRPLNDGHCDPEQCEQYQAKQCNLTGRFIFYVPRIASLDAFELPTNSFYALSRAIEKFKALALLGRGRLSGFLDNNGATFYLTKQLRSVSHINAQGQAERVDHWLIELEAPLDVSALLLGDDAAQRLARAESAVGLLEAPEGPAPAEAGRGADAAPPKAAERARRDLEQEPASGRLAPLAVSSATLADAGAAAPPPPAAMPGDADMARICALVQARGLDPEAYCQAVDQRLGAGWRRNGRARAAVEQELSTANGKDQP